MITKVEMVSYIFSALQIQDSPTPNKKTSHTKNTKIYTKFIENKINLNKEVNVGLYPIYHFIYLVV